MSDTVERIKEKLSIQDVVSPYVKLTRAGKYWKGLSPFTKEKTPSFFVSPDRGLYHCFSTGKGGDMFTFVQEMEGVDFKGALKILAEKAGVPLSYERGDDGEKELIFKALQAAKDFYVRELKKNDAARSYLLSRGLKEGTIEEWELGFAPEEWRALLTELTAKGFSEGILEKAGLVKRPDEGGADKKMYDQAKSEEVLRPAGRMYDRFRGRVMFPIFDVSGRIVGFSGRILKEDPAHPGAKYINSPETPVFDKSRALYGVHAAREGIRALGAAILVEGQLDILMAHQAGYKNTVATSGTAFTERHAELIGRYTPNLLIAYDGDRAGIAAAGRAVSIALPRGMNVKIAAFPAGEDPADVIKANPESFRRAIKEASHAVDFFLERVKDAKYDPRTFKLEVSRTVLPFVALIGNRIDQAHFVTRVAEALSVPEDAVKAEVSKIAQPSASGREAAETSEPFLSRTDTVERLVFGLMLLYKEQGKEDESRRAEDALKTSVGEERLKELHNITALSRAALFEADFFLTRHEGDAEEAIAELYADLAKEARHEAYRDTLSRLRAAEKEGNQESVSALMTELARLASELH
jgi:DNA primase